MIIAVTSSKGGAGKTTSSCILAANLFGEFNVSIALVDCDPQESAVRSRERDIDELRNAGLNSKLYRTASNNNSKHGKPFCHISKLDLFQDYKTIYKKLDELNKIYDVVLVDFPGSLNLHKNTLYILQKLDFIFIPIYVDDNSLDSTLSFYKQLNSLKENNKIKAQMHLFFNKFNTGRGKNATVFNEWSNIFKSKGIPVMDNHIFDSINHERYSTIDTIKSIHNSSSAYKWIKEVFNILNL